MAGKTRRVGKSLIAVVREFAAEESCHKFLEMARWPEGVRCLKCNSDHLSKYKTNDTTRVRVNSKGEKVTVKVPGRYLYQCLNPDCRYQFSTTTGTVFNDTHLPLSKWFLATGIMCNAKKSVSAKQMERDLDVSYKTAWYLNHRIRKAMDEANGHQRFTGIVEMDETYVGGKHDKRRKRKAYDKDMVFGMIERKGDVRAWHVEKQGKYASVVSKIQDNVSVKAEG